MNAPRYARLAALLLGLCCLALLSAMPALAQAQGADENGRSAADRSQRGAPTQVEQTGTTDVWKGCDFDDCSQRRVAEPGDQAGPGAVEAEAGKIVGSAGSLQVQAGAPLNSVFVAGDGDIGVGTEAPAGRLHVVANPGAEDARTIFVLDANGNVEIGGLLTEASSVLLKENFEAVDVQDVLQRLARLPITTWNYRTDDPAVRHMGPVAQDFYAAFGLGADDEHLAPLDANGVALAAVQALAQQNQAQADRIATLEAQNAQLLERLEALEALVLPRDE
ncbi:MAG: tail fiber domain-containing protein [Rhodothermales bacterium]|nr:tail fiber domain-containing protein [Rhodothermales bacterium]